MRVETTLDPGMYTALVTLAAAGGDSVAVLLRRIVEQSLGLVDNQSHQ